MPDKSPINEITLRGLVLGIALTLVFTASNVYLGLKVGLTVATSIPAAVIAMAVLSGFRNNTILENNIVQTVASAAGTLSAIIFVLPGLVIVGWWNGFPFVPTFLVCAAGGVLGVLFTIPLRRAMVTHSDLPYPEGVAAAQLLDVGDKAKGGATAEAREGLWAVIWGTLASAGLAIAAATGYAVSEVSRFFKVGAAAATGVNMGFSLALVGAGYLVGLSVGLAMLLGVIIAWGAAVPYLTALMPAAAGVGFEDHIISVWRNQVRFIGAGAISVAAIWTLIKLAGPVVSGVVGAISAARTASNAPIWTCRPCRSSASSSPASSSAATCSTASSPRRRSRRPPCSWSSPPFPSSSSAVSSSPRSAATWPDSSAPRTVRSRASAS